MARIPNEIRDTVLAKLGIVEKVVEKVKETERKKTSKTTGAVKFGKVEKIIRSKKKK